jgi:hypothetical protein
MKFVIPDSVLQRLRTINLTLNSILNAEDYDDPDFITNKMKFKFFEKKNFPFQKFIILVEFI